MPSRQALKSSDFVHLHNHTEYSVLDGLTKLRPLMEKVAAEGMSAVAMTDHGTMSGAIDFYKEAKGHDIKPIIGIEAYVASRKHTDKEPDKDKNRFHLILLAMNNQGYKNLMQLSSIANLEGFYYYPRVDHDLIKKYNEGIICLSGCLGGEVGDALTQGQYDKAKSIATWYKEVFGDRYYLEIQDHGHPKNQLSNDIQARANQDLIKLGKELDIEVVLTCDAHYLDKADQEAHEILLCVGTASYFDDTNRMSLKEFPLYVESPKEIIKRWGIDNPEAVLNTKRIADRCQIDIKLGEILIPKFDVPKGETEQSYLTNSVYRGLAWRYGGLTRDKADKAPMDKINKAVSKEVKSRADYELSVIKQMGFSGYFLIIADLVNWGKSRGIAFGPGRGSAAGSIISYALRITEIDPIAYDLMFERFLNPDRISMPDIDIDIQDTRRDEVIEYCVNTYGRERVANIVTFGRMFARNAVRDVARVLKIPYSEADRLAKMLPLPIQGRHIPLEVSLKENIDLKNEYRASEDSRQILDLAVKLEGTIRSHGVHAAGIVIAPDNIVSFVPLEMAQKGVVATQYSMGPIEELGLLKMDLLGLSNLTIIKNSLRIIKRVYKRDIDIDKIPLDDEETYKLFGRGDTVGIFQFESSGMKRYIKELKPSSIEDIIAMNGLYRPGPLTAGLTQKFIDRKNGKEPISYDHEKMKAALSSTYGVMVYQEQVMQIAKDMCGFTGGEADSLRKAVGKKIRSMMAKMKDKIIEGAVKNGVDKKIAEKFWADVEGFADYAFTKAHAACYGLIGYQTAYLKAHYPSAFMAAVMTTDYDNTDRLAIEIAECKHLGIDVLPPDINQSFLEFAIVPDTNQIRFGLLAIKNVGTGAVEEILRVREDGPYLSLEDFFARVNTRIVNRKALDSLIKAGGFDSFGDRNYLLHNLDNLLAYSSRRLKDVSSGQTDLFGNLTHAQGSNALKLKLDESPALTSDREKLDWERELIGIYLSQHPLKSFQVILADKTNPIKDVMTASDGKAVSVGGVITAVRDITTRNGSKMAFVRLEDGEADVELIIFPSLYQKQYTDLVRDSVVLATGKLSTKNRQGEKINEPKVIVDTLRTISPEEAAEYKPTSFKSTSVKSSALVSGPATSDEYIEAQRLFIRLQNSEDQALLMSLKQTIDDHAGDTDVVLVLGPTDNKQIIKLPMKILTDDISINKLEDLVGSENIRLS